MRDFYSTRLRIATIMTAIVCVSVLSAGTFTGIIVSKVSGTVRSRSLPKEAYQTQGSIAAKSSVQNVSATQATPVVSTEAATEIYSFSATVNGTVSDLGTSNPTASGFCWNTSGTPLISNNKVDNGPLTAKGSFSARLSGLTAGTTYYVRAFATNASGTTYGNEIHFTTLQAGTWIGMIGSDWNDAQNWSDGKVPTATTDVTIPALPLGGYLPIIFGNASADCNNLITANNYLEVINDKWNGHGSLIVHGTASGSVQTDIYFPKSQWNLMSPSGTGNRLIDFLYNANSQSQYIAQETINGVTYYGMKDFDEAKGQWSMRFSVATPGNFTTAKGYLINFTDDSYYLYNCGVLATGNQTVTLTKNGDGWNCIGNPYTSSLDINTTAGNTSFLYVNAVATTGCLDNSYAGVYTLDPSTGRYKVICNAGCYFTGIESTPVNADKYVQSGTGFFVKAASASKSVRFTTAMQSHQRSASPTGTSWPAINLSVTDGTVTGSTVVTFNSAMTVGLDPTYDAGLLRDSSGLALYSRLVSDNGVDFAIQCLPENYTTLVVPIGLENKNASSVTFSASSTQLPSNCEVILEDRAKNTFTSLKGNATYTTTVQAGTNSTGRFFLHTGNSTTDIHALSDKLFLNASTDGGQLILTGEVSAAAKAYLYDVSGRQVKALILNEGYRNTIPAAGLGSGVYLLRVTDGAKQFSTKVLL